MHLDWSWWDWNQRMHLDWSCWNRRMLDWVCLGWNRQMLDWRWRVCLDWNRRIHRDWRWWTCLRRNRWVLIIHNLFEYLPRDDWIYLNLDFLQCVNDFLNRCRLPRNPLHSLCGEGLDLNG